MMWRLGFVLLLVGCGIPAALATASPAVRMQLPNIYVEPASGSMDDTFTFFGSGFVPDSSINVHFVSPDSEIVPYADSPVTISSDGSYSFKIVPLRDLSDIHVADGRVSPGPWIETVVLEDGTYYQQEFDVRH